MIRHLALEVAAVVALFAAVPAIAVEDTAATVVPQFMHALPTCRARR